MATFDSETDLILKYYIVVFGNYIKSNKTSSGQNSYEPMIQILERRILVIKFLLSSHVYLILHIRAVKKGMLS